MSRAFQYRPKFVDIRVRPPGSEDTREDDVLKLKPGERRCDWPGCPRPGENRAPKSRELIHEHYWFCQPHAAEYNRGWNFFSGMTEGQVRAWQEEQLKTGGRPTWEMRASARSREAAAFAARFGGPNVGGAGTYRDPFDIFARGDRPAAEVAPVRHVGRLERQALADLDLEVDADREAVRLRYLDLVKRCHPDTNGGDRGAEEKLQRVLKAYKTLKSAGMA